MAKGIGLIGNFRGKVGNMVGYNLKDSNNKQTQGVRVYQPVVKNPKTYGQAEQRAKLAPINATYRALKMLIDRGQEGKAYGNKSRLAWLSDALKAFNGCWFEKGATISAPAIVPLTKGSLGISMAFADLDGVAELTVTGVTTAGTNTVGKLAIAMKNQFPALQEGDQVTFVVVGGADDSLATNIVSIVIDSTSTDSIPAGIAVDADIVDITAPDSKCKAAAIIVSREGANGQHLRNTASLVNGNQMPDDWTDASRKEAAIKSYMSAGANTDWAEESLQ